MPDFGGFLGEAIHQIWMDCAVGKDTASPCSRNPTQIGRARDEDLVKGVEHGSNENVAALVRLCPLRVGFGIGVARLPHAVHGLAQRIA